MFVCGHRLWDLSGLSVLGGWKVGLEDPSGESVPIPLMVWRIGSYTINCQDGGGTTIRRELKV